MFICFIQFLKINQIISQININSSITSLQGPHCRKVTRQRPSTGRLESTTCVWDATVTFYRRKLSEYNFVSISVLFGLSLNIKTCYFDMLASRTSLKESYFILRNVIKIDFLKIMLSLSA